MANITSWTWSDDILSFLIKSWRCDSPAADSRNICRGVTSRPLLSISFVGSWNGERHWRLSSRRWFCATIRVQHWPTKRIISSCSIDRDLGFRNILSLRNSSPKLSKVTSKAAEYHICIYQLFSNAPLSTFKVLPFFNYQLGAFRVLQLEYEIYTRKYFFPDYRSYKMLSGYANIHPNIT